MHNADKRKVFQAHVVQIQTLQNELKSLKAQLANLKGKSSQLANHAQHVQGSRSQEGPPRLFYSLSLDVMVGEHVLSSAHNFSLTPKLTFFFSLPTSRHKRLVWHLEFLPLGRQFRLMDSHLVQLLLRGP
jgi:hypothetical protein